MKTVYFVSLLLFLLVNCVCGNLENENTLRNKTHKKRGIYHHNFAGLQHGLTYSIPPSYAAGYHAKHFAPNPYNQQFIPTAPSADLHPHHQFTPALAALHPQHAGFPYGLIHGDATVTSYSANFPRFPYYGQKSVVPFATFSPFVAPNLLPVHHQNILPYPVAPLPSPLPLLRPAQTVFPIQPSFIVPQKPIIPVAVPATKYPNVFFTKPNPIFIQPSTPAIDNPTYTVASIQPQLVPIPFPSQSTSSQTPTSSHTPTSSQTPTSLPIPLPGTNFVTSTNPDQQSWRPVFIGQTTPFLPTPTSPSTTTTTTTTATVSRPPISLLPPYLSPNFGSNSQSSLGQNNNGHQHHNNNFNGHEFSQGRQQDQGPLNGQGYDVASNTGRYTGPSSYEVRLGTRREY